MAAVGQRAGVLLAAAAAVGVLHAAGVPLPVCPFRAATGLPCPLCGGTTAALAIAHLDPVGALLASPLAVLGALGLAALPVRRPPWRRLPAAARAGLLGLVLALSEAWQLVRLGLV